MSFFSRFTSLWNVPGRLGVSAGKTLPFQPGWPEVPTTLARALWHLLQTNPGVLSSPYARVVLHHDWKISILADRTDPHKMLGWRDVALVFLQEHEEALACWFHEIKADSRHLYQRAATEDYAEKIALVLRGSVQLADGGALGRQPVANKNLAAAG